RTRTNQAGSPRPYHPAHLPDRDYPGHGGEPERRRQRNSRTCRPGAGHGGGSLSHNLHMLHRLLRLSNPFLGGTHFDPYSVGRLGVAVFVVPVPPRVRLCLGVALGRVLPVLLASECGEVEVASGAPHWFVAAVVDEVGAEHAVAVADE